jgi:type IV pilus assembly protein PilQ
MRINLEKSSPDFSSVPFGSGLPPAINTQRAITTLLVADGETTVIGGIYTSDSQNTTRRTPGISQIPLLGWLFRSDSVQDRAIELLIFITPRILKV